MNVRKVCVGFIRHVRFEHRTVHRICQLHSIAISDCKYTLLTTETVLFITVKTTTGYYATATKLEVIQEVFNEYTPRGGWRGCQEIRSFIRLRGVSVFTRIERSTGFRLYLILETNLPKCLKV